MWNSPDLPDTEFRCDDDLGGFKMGRRTFTREFKLEAVKLVTERGITKSQAARDLGIHANLLRNWIEDFARDVKQAFPGRGKLRADDAEIVKLKRELADTKAERDILKKAIAYFAKERR
jgi:transposase